MLRLPRPSCANSMPAMNGCLRTPILAPDSCWVIKRLSWSRSHYPCSLIRMAAATMSLSLQQRSGVACSSSSKQTSQLLVPAVR
jgi:hypothetical protein